MWHIEKIEIIDRVVRLPTVRSLEHVRDDMDTTSTKMVVELDLSLLVVGVLRCLMKNW